MIFDKRIDGNRNIIYIIVLVSYVQAHADKIKMPYKFLLSILFVVLIIYYCIVVPYPLKYYILYNTRTFQIYRPDDNVLHFTSKTGAFSTDMKNTDASIYIGTDKLLEPGLLVWFNGGAFLKTDRRSSFGVLNELSRTLPYYDIVTFDYPTRFRYTLRDSLDRVYKILNIVHEKKIYKTMYGIGISAGVLLAGAYQNNEINDKAMRKIKIPRNGKPFSGIISLCGLLTPSFYDPYIDSAFKFYFMRNTPGAEYFTCANLPNTPKLVLSSTVDYLRAQTLRFIETEPCISHIYKSNTLPHSFPLMIHFDETADLVKRIKTFVGDVQSYKTESR